MRKKINKLFICLKLNFKNTINVISVFVEIRQNIRSQGLPKIMLIIFIFSRIFARARVIKDRQDKLCGSGVPPIISTPFPLFPSWMDSGLGKGNRLDGMKNGNPSVFFVFLRHYINCVLA